MRQLLLVGVCVGLSAAQPALDAWIDRLVGPGLMDAPGDRLAAQYGGGSGGAITHQEGQALSNDELMEEIAEIEREAFGMARLFDQLRFFNPFANMMFPELNGLGNNFSDPLMAAMMHGPGGIDLLPNVTISGADCLVTVDLKGMDMNSTSIKIYSSEHEVDLEISYVKSETLKTYNATDEDDGNVMHSSGLSRLPDPPGAGGEPKPKLRGIGSVTSVTTVRSFPAPKECDMTAQSSKATVNHELNQLLLKFPKKTGSEEAVAPAVQSEAAAQVFQAVEEPPVKQHWWQSAFASTKRTAEKIPVPIVQNDEF